MTRDMLHMVGGEHSLKMSAPLLEGRWFEDLEEKGDPVSYLMNYLIHYEADYKPSPATMGLLTSLQAAHRSFPLQCNSTNMQNPHIQQNHLTFELMIQYWDWPRTVQHSLFHDWKRHLKPFKLAAS